MLRVVLAREHLLCGFDDGIDPGKDQGLVREKSRGVRPSVFFGPKRDALSLITRKLHTAMIVKPKRLTDFSTSICVLHFPGGDVATKDLWKESAQKLSTRSQKIHSIDLIEAESKLSHSSDVYKQVFTLPMDRQAELPIKLHITSFLAQDSLYEKCDIEGLDLEHYEAYLVHWHQPEIAASEILQSTAYSQKSSWVCSWRGNIYFQVQAKSGDELAKLSFAECGWLQNHQSASERFHDVIDAISFSDTCLGYDASSKDKKLPWLGLESRSAQALGKTDAMMVWKLDKSDWQLRYRYADSLDKIEASHWPNFEDNLSSVLHADRSWLEKQKKAPAHLPAQVVDLYERTLLTLRQMQDPEGGIIAAPEFQFEFSHCGGYGFCWGRDAGFITLAMDICGMHEESAEFYRYMTRCQSSDGSFLHRHDMSGHLGSSWGFLQPDETGSVLFGLWKHLELTKNTALAEELKPMIDKACEWLIAAKHSWDEKLPIEGFDLWEEREGVHYYAVAAMSAGIQAAIDIYKLCDWSYPNHWQSSFAALKELANSEQFIHKTADGLKIARTLHKKLGVQAKSQLEARGYEIASHPCDSGRFDYTLPADFVVDISQIGVAFPYEILDHKKLGTLWNDYLKLVDARLWRGESGGIGRYEGDYYREGNPWILATLWLALAAAQVEEFDLAKKCWQWSLAHVSHEGLFAEQIDPESGQPAWVMPLTWSHAMFALAVHMLPEEVIR